MPHSHKHQALQNQDEQLYLLLTETEVLDEVERDYWLSNFGTLHAQAKHDLIELIETAEHESRRESDRFTAALAEVNAKLEEGLKKFQTEHKLILKNPPRKTAPVLEEEYLDQLADLGEL